MRLSHTLGHSKWTIINFTSELNLQVERLDPCKNLSCLPTSEEVVYVFVKRQQNGWKVRVDKHLYQLEYNKLLNL
jgi:hypothetical protein